MILYNKDEILNISERKELTINNNLYKLIFSILYNEEAYYYQEIQDDLYIESFKYLNKKYERKTSISINDRVVILIYVLQKRNSKLTEITPENKAPNKKIKAKNIGIKRDTVIGLNSRLMNHNSVVSMAEAKTDLIPNPVLNTRIYEAQNINRLPRTTSNLFGTKIVKISPLPNSIVLYVNLHQFLGFYPFTFI